MDTFYEKLTQNAEGYEYHQIPGNHLLQMTNPGKTAKLIEMFINDVTEPTSLEGVLQKLHGMQSV